MDDHTLHPSLSWLLLPLVLFLTVLGALSSPPDAQRKPLLLLPDVKAVEDYRHSMSSHTAGMQLQDGEISVFLGNIGSVNNVLMRTLVTWRKIRDIR